MTSAKRKILAFASALTLLAPGSWVLADSTSDSSGGTIHTPNNDASTGGTVTNTQT
jgi:hypothetical protein